MERSRLRVGALFLYGEKTFKDEKVKGWKGEKMMFKGEKVKRRLAPFKGEKVKRWLHPLKEERVIRWKSEKMAAHFKVKKWKVEKVKKWLAPLKGERVKGWKGEKMAAPTDDQVRQVVAWRTR